MRKSKDKVSSMQVEVWRMKEKVYKDTRGMDGAAYFQYVQNKSRNVLKPTSKKIFSTLAKG